MKYGKEAQANKPHMGVQNAVGPNTAVIHLHVSGCGVGPVTNEIHKSKPDPQGPTV